MGLAQLPRAYFSGFTYWNPSTMNNNDYQPTYNPATATLNWPWLERHGLQNADDFDAYVTQIGIVPTPNSALNAGIVSNVPPAEWNFYGDNSCGFVQPDDPVIESPDKFSKPAGSLGITGFTNPQGAFVTANDPWISLPIRLNAGMHAAKLVDVDPTCPWSSQIYCDTISLGDAATKSGFTGKTAGRAHSRWVFFSRNLNKSNDVIIAGIASAMFQLALPTDGITFFDPTPPAGSLAAELKAALGQSAVRGVMMRFVMYHTIYFQGAAFTGTAPDWKGITTLYAAYARDIERYRRGELEARPRPPVNRAYSSTVGWIAPWTTSDMKSMAVGRALHTPGPLTPVDTSLGPTGIGPAVVEFAPDAANPSNVGRLTIDLGSSIPELDSKETKVDFGTMQLALAGADAGAPPTPIAAIPYAGGYDKAAYRATAGVVDIPSAEFLTPLTVADMQRPLVVTFPDPKGGDPQVAYQEAVYTAETDDRAVYLNQPDAPWENPQSSPARNVTVQVRYLGGKPPKDAYLRLAQYSPNPPGFSEGVWGLVSDVTGAQAQPPYATLNAGGNAVFDGAYTTVQIPWDDNGLTYGTVTVSLQALRSGPPLLVFNPLPPSSTPPKGGPKGAIPFPDVMQTFFANVRVLPYHNDMAVAFESWLLGGPPVDEVSQRVFDSVFRTFFIMYPAMRFLRDPLQFQAWRGPILAVTDPAIFETASYMPVMRSMSAGQRRILEVWSSYLDGELPTPAAAPRPLRRG